MTFFSVINIDLLTSSLRLDRIINKNITFITLNSFSANRLIGYQYGLEVWINHPFVGKGIGNVDISSISRTKDIHNGWIKNLAESGIGIFLFLLGFIIYPIRKGWRYIKKFKNDVTIYFFLILSGGALLTLFEPNVIFNSFKNSSIWWLSLAVILCKIKHFNPVNEKI
jgi:O-antigen ligase